MIRILLLQHTGASAINLKIARRLAQKVRGAQLTGRCVLLDCEDVEVSEECLQILVSVACAGRRQSVTGRLASGLRPSDSAAHPSFSTQNLIREGHDQGIRRGLWPQSQYLFENFYLDKVWVRLA